MRIKLVLLSSLILFCLSAVNVVADEYKLPRDREVVIAVRLVMEPQIDDAFYSQYWHLRSKLLKISGRRVQEGEVVSSTARLETGNGVWTYNSLPLGNVGSFATVKLKIPKERTVHVNGFYVEPADIGLFSVGLPIMAQFDVPEDVNYVYLGTFVCSWEGSQYDIKSIKRVDEYEQAQQIVRQRYGSDARLLRVPLKAQSFE